MRVSPWQSLVPKVFPKEVLGKDRVDGHYSTPPLTTEYMCAMLLSKYQRGMKILDPAVGMGTFVKKLILGGVAPDDIIAYDIDADKVAIASRLGCRAEMRDATIPITAQFDMAIGNPPYNGDESHYVRENRRRLEFDYPNLGARNTLSIIMFNAIRSLRPGGFFCFIAADGFLTQKYYLEFREYLLSNTQLNEILLAPPKLFWKQSADQRTCIISGLKRVANTTSLPLFMSPAEQKTDLSVISKVRLVDRIQSENDYTSPPKVELISQDEIKRYPSSSIIIGAPRSLRDLFLNASVRVGDIAKGGTGISTGKDSVFLRKKSEVSNSNDWVPYYKNGARQPFWYEPQYYIERDYKKNAALSRTFMIRNERYFFKEGITCSSVGIRFSAAYMPEGGLFGVNANFFFDSRSEMFYMLALLNTRLAWFINRKMIIRTNNISANYLRMLPYIEPIDHSFKDHISSYVEDIVESLRAGLQVDVESHVNLLTEWFYDIYGISDKDAVIIDDFCENFSASM